MMVKEQHSTLQYNLYGALWSRTIEQRKNLTQHLKTPQRPPGAHRVPPLEALIERPGNADGWNGPYLKSGVPLDPWKNEYQYRNPGTRGEIDILSLGQDAAEGGDGENTDVGNW